MSDYSSHSNNNNNNNDNNIVYNNNDNNDNNDNYVQNESILVTNTTPPIDSPKRVSFSTTPSKYSPTYSSDYDSDVEIIDNKDISSDQDQDDDDDDEDNNVYQIVVNNKDSTIVNNNNNNSNDDDESSITTTTTIYQLKNPSKSESQKFWKFIGFILQILGLLAITFTVFLGLYLDDIVDWSYWILFTPIYLMLAIGFLATGSRLLSKLVSWVIRMIWRLWLIGFSFFVVFLILYLEYSYLSLHALLLPILITFVITLLFGLGSILFGACCNKKKPKRKRKYILSGLPLLFLGLTLTPSGIMIGLRIMDILSIKYSVCFIPLFVGDILFSCFSFLLLLFSFGGRENATFTIPQLFSILIILLCDIAFKILIALRFDSNYDITFFEIFIPIFVGELFLIFCGFNVFRKPLKTQYLDDDDENSSPQSINSNNNEQAPLLKNKNIKSKYSRVC